MKKNTKIILAIIVILAVLAILFFIYYPKPKEFDVLKENYPELSSFIEKIESANVEMESDSELIENYLELGLAWKSLADRTNESSHYEKALQAYKQGVIKTQEKNTVLLMNAGNMAKYINDYSLAEQYYKKAIEVSPGEVNFYITLAELYEYKMKKDKSEIIALYEQGIKRVLNPSVLQQRIKMLNEN